VSDNYLPIGPLAWIRARKLRWLRGLEVKGGRLSSNGHKTVVSRSGNDHPDLIEGSVLQSPPRRRDFDVVNPRLGLNQDRQEL
jgi:hypothetical protein